MERRPPGIEGISTLGGGGLRPRNEHGVITRLESRTEGLQLNVVSASGIRVKMA
jgi:hypothetical protein